MKISFTPPIYTKAENKGSNKQVTTNPNQNRPQIPMSEQSDNSSSTPVNGASSFPGNRFTEYFWTEKNASNRRVYNQLVCDNETGDRSHIKTDKNGNFIGSDEYYRKQKSRITTTIDENGISIITTLTPTTKTQERLDQENRPIILAHTDANGNKRVEITDYARHRMVIKETTQGGDEQTRVINIATGKEVTAGPLVIDRRYDKETNTYITENIVTKDILKKEQFSPKGLLLSQIIYFPETGQIQVQKEYNAELDSYEIKTYSKSEGYPLATFVIESRDKTQQHVKTYEADGTTIHSNILYLRKKNSDKIETEIKFKDDTEIIEQEIVYGKEKARKEYYFYEEPNVPKCMLLYGKDGTTRISETYYQKDGETIAYKNTFKDDGSVIQSLYNAEGKKRQIRYFDAQEQIKFLEDIDPETGALKHTVSFDHKNGTETITSYDEDYELPFKQTIRTKDKIVLAQSIFHPDGKTPQYIRTYNNDRSYVDTEYNEKGEEIKSESFNADGTKKIKQKKSNQKTTTAKTVQTQTQQNEKEEEFLRRLVKNIEKEDINKSLTDAEWKRLAQIFGLDDPNMIKNMEPQTCRSIVLKFHPNNSTNATKIRDQEIFKIITALFKGQNS